METNPLQSSSRAPPPSAQEAPTLRLVIRVRIPETTTSGSAPARRSRRALAIAAAVVAIASLLIWVGIDLFRTETTAEPDARSESLENAPQPPAVAASASTSASSAPRPQLSATQAVNAPPASVPIASTNSAPTIAKAPDAPTSPTTEVIPDAARSALQTIRGTIRVLIRVTINKEGTVIAATSQDSGPSRYFERISLEAAKKWTFTPVVTDSEPRTMLLRFHFTRYGATASAASP